MPYPILYAGQRIRASLLAAMQPLRVSKAVFTTRTSTTALAADPHLVLAVAANAVYDLDGWIEYSGAFGAGDLKMDFTVPSGATMRWSPLGNAPADTTQKYASGSVAYNSPLAVGTYGVGATRNAASPRGQLITVSAGNLTFRWSQNSSNTTGTTVYENSWIRLIRVG
ncbi:hypothetical protein [Streptomyces subrutilus]|uniref:hypothetical protein n=1 Tax=Streptomyces subrutilus TaxID=36818 RepID=UPI002E13CD28|nr:hypothetical protein OG479_33035 [Streptomyces subrutilus]